MITKMSEQHVTSRQLQAERTKKNIYKAAIGLLENKSLESIRISDIARAAGVAAGTFYRYYETKWDVFLESYSLIDDYFEQEVAPQLTQLHVYDRILFFFDQYALYHINLDIEYVRLIYNSKNTVLNRADFTVEYDRGGLGLLRKTIQKGIDDHQLSNRDSAIDVLRLLMIAVRGLIFNWCTLEQTYDLRSELKAYVTRLLRIFEP